MLVDVGAAVVVVVVGAAVVVVVGAAVVVVVVVDVSEAPEYTNSPVVMDTCMIKKSTSSTESPPAVHTSLPFRATITMDAPVSGTSRELDGPKPYTDTYVSFIFDTKDELPDGFTAA
mmetsp:Transcript_25335/g.29445  ORF Transcript_25335/g.29445 Transcript_25335/m.29445 type:complete len:117 (+) Transcript_25335:529-879(+)